MAQEILSDSFVLKLSKGIDPVLVPANNLSIYLGFSQAEGNCAAIGANVLMSQRKAIEDLIFKYVMKHGKRSDSALKLRSIFLKNDMKDPADFIRAELEKFKIPIPSDAEAVIDPPISLPSPPRGTPGEVAEACTTTGSGAGRPTDEPMEI